MMTSQILRFVDFTKTQKSRYLEKKTFFLQIKKSLITHHFMGKKCFVAEVTFKYYSINFINDYIILQLKYYKNYSFIRVSVITDAN